MNLLCVGFRLCGYCWVVDISCVALYVWVCYLFVLLVIVRFVCCGLFLLCLLFGLIVYMVVELGRVIVSN